MKIREISALDYNVYTQVERDRQTLDRSSRDFCSLNPTIQDKYNGAHIYSAAIETRCKRHQHAKLADDKDATI